jgi:DNA-binding winged helix-turn-helix (wHTH) protein
MKISWEYNVNTEIRRLIFTAERVKNLFYQQNGFLVLPELSDNYRSVYFPDYHYSQIPDFWNAVPDVTQKKEMSKLKIDLPSNVNQTLTKRIKKDLLSKNEIGKKKKEWQEVEKQFLEILNSIFDLSGIKIIIRPTRFGTSSSYFPIFQNGDSKIIIYHRIDSDITTIAEVIITASIVFTASKKEIYKANFWEKKETATDFLFKYTKLAKLFPSYIPTMKILEENTTCDKLMRKSFEYLKKLGYYVKSPLEIKDKKILINNKKIKKEDFSKEEQSILQEFISNRGKIVSFDRVGEIVWKDESEKFSLWAIAKKIERIRKKIREYGVNYNVIETFRKKGYMLYD